MSGHKVVMDLSWLLSSSEVNKIHSSRFEWLSKFTGRNNFENWL